VGFGVTVAAKARVRVLLLQVGINPLSNYPNAADSGGASPLMQERRISW
jgi:hypothetical protein